MPPARLPRVPLVTLSISDCLSSTIARTAPPTADSSHQRAARTLWDESAPRRRDRGGDRERHHARVAPALIDPDEAWQT